MPPGPAHEIGLPSLGLAHTAPERKLRVARRGVLRRQLGYNESSASERVPMASESAPRTGSNEESGSDGRGQLIIFPDRRSFGPFRWRTVKIASFAVLVLMLSGFLLQLFLQHALRDARPASPNTARVPS